MCEHVLKAVCFMCWQGQRAVCGVKEQEPANNDFGHAPVSVACGEFGGRDNLFSTRGIIWMTMPTKDVINRM